MLDGLSTELVGAAIYDLGKFTLSRISSIEWVQTTLKKWNLKSEQHDFAARYLEAICELRLQGKQVEILQFFSDEDVRHTFFNYYYGASTIRGNEDLRQQSLDNCLKALQVGDEIKAANVDVGAEVQAFWVTFQQKVQESRTVKEVEIEQQFRQLKSDTADIHQVVVQLKGWMEKSGKDQIQIADKIYNIEKIDNATFNNLLNSSAQDQAITNRAARHKPVPDVYPRTYVGRQTAVKRLQSFFESPQQHFLFLFGTGGIGKSHLLQEVAGRLSVQPAYFKLSKSTKFITLANEMGYGDFAQLSPTQQRDLFLKKAAEETEPLIFDDFYEVGDEFLYKTILELSNQRTGKVLLISRALPLDYDGIYLGEERQLELNELGEADFAQHLKNYHAGAGYDFELSPDLITACWEHCKGYPLGGEFLLKLRDTSGNDFGQDIASIGKINPDSNKRHHDFMKRLLGSIFEKGTSAEQELAKQMAVFMEPMHRDVFAGLPAFERDAFYSLTERKKIFYSILGDFFGVHALVRTVLEGEVDVSTDAHIYAGNHYESDAETLMGVNLENLNKAVYHFEKSTTLENEDAYAGFLARWKPKFNFISVKTLIVADTKKTIDNFRFRLRLEPDDFSAMNELGRAFRKDGQINNAIEILKKAVDKGNVHAMNELGITYREVNRLPEAIEVLKKAAAQGNIQSFNELGIAYREANRLHEAIEVLKKAVDAGNIQSFNELGIAYREANKFPEAIEVLKKAVDAGNIQSFNELGIAYREAKRLPEAIEVLKKAVAAGNIQSFNQLGIAYREAKRLPEAIEVLKKAADTGHLQSMNELGITYREANQLPEAIEVLKKAVILQPDNVILLNQLGISYREANRLHEAIEVLKKAADEGHVQSMNELGITYREANRLHEAIEVLKKAADKGHVHAMNELGRTYREANRFHEAIEVLKKAAEEGNVHSMNELGIAYREAKRLPEAIEVLKKAVDAGNIHSMNELGIAYREANRLPEAIEIWENVLSEHPNQHHTRLAILQIYLFYSPDVEKVKVHFERLSPKFPAGRIRLTYESIAEHFESIVNLRSHNKSLYRRYIWLLFKYQSWDWAVVFLEKLIQVHLSVEFKANFGKALSMVGRATEAKPFLKAAMEASDRPGKERYFQQNAADYLDALKRSGSNKEAYKKFNALRERLLSLPDFESRKAYWLGEQDDVG